MTEPDYPSRKAPRFLIRFPEGMREQIQELAARNHRSMNAEILARVRESLDADASPAGRRQWQVQQPRSDYQRGRDDADIEARLLTVIRAMPRDKQLALLKLLSE